VPEPSLVEVKIAILKSKSYRSPDTDQIPAKLINARGETLCSETNLFVLYGIRRNCHSNGRNLILYRLKKLLVKLILIIIVKSPSYKMPNILHNFLPARLTPKVNEFIQGYVCGFRCNRSATDQILYIRQILEEKWEYNGAVHQLFIDFKKACKSIKGEVLYNILLELGITKKIVRLLRMCLNEN
jgi:hypothetical protein